MCPEGVPTEALSNGAWVTDAAQQLVLPLVLPLVRGILPGRTGRLSCHAVLSACHAVCPGGVPTEAISNGAWSTCSAAVPGSLCTGLCDRGFRGSPTATRQEDGAWAASADYGGCNPIGTQDGWRQGPDYCAPRACAPRPRAMCASLCSAGCSTSTRLHMVCLN